MFAPLQLECVSFTGNILILLSATYLEILFD